MKYAIVGGSKKFAGEAKSGEIGQDIWYPEYPVVACVGKYRQYWKYIDDKPQLPDGYEPESEWHSAWKSTVKKEACEVICGENREHRADIKTNQYVIEIQKSPICGLVVEERINFYKNLTNNRVVWVVNVERPWKEQKIERMFDPIPGKINIYIFKWKRMWQWVFDIAMRNDSKLFLDFNPVNENLIQVWGNGKTLYCSWFKKSKFFLTYLEGVSIDKVRSGEIDFMTQFYNLGSQAICKRS